MSQHDVIDPAEVVANELVRLMSERRKQGEQAAFLDRHRARWAESLLLAETFITASAEMGSEINEAEGPAAVERQDYKFEALIRNHARQVRMAREVQLLAAGGYAGGALARWRSMHELAAVTLLLHREPPEIAERYMHHDLVERLKSASEHESHAARLRCARPSADELAALEAHVGALGQKYGDAFARPNGWAAPVFPGRRRIFFSNIEEHVGLDHWRPRYNLASQDVHAPSIAGRWSLASGPMDDFVLVGRSTEGLAEALHPTMIALNIVNMTLVERWPSEDRLLLLHALRILEVRGGQALLREAGDEIVG